MSKNNVPISYSSRDFASIKSELVAHAKRYYPDTFKDFNEAGFGSLMMDAVAYIGDQLSFMVDYQANESFLTTANEYENINKLAKQMGYRARENPSSYGIATFFIMVPSNVNGLGPDPRYIPILKSGSILSARNGNIFTLTEDVIFSGANNEIVVAQVNDDTGVPTSYAIRGYGRVVSGKTEETFITVGSFTRFLKLPIEISNIAEIINVEDEEGHKYYEVDYLSQDVVYRPVANRTTTAQDATALLRPFTVPRRFVVERDGRSVLLQFGHGSDSADTTADKVADPSNVILQQHGKTYISDTSFDPTSLISTDKFGIVPADTVLRVEVRVNSVDNVNAGVDTLTNVVTPILEFTDVTTLNASSITFVRNSLESTNEEAIIGDVSTPSVEELKTRVFNSFSSQNRAVTREDYIALIYQMPPMYGSLKKVNVVRDSDSFKRNLNIYVISENEGGKLIATNSTIKENLKMWLNKNKMINDTLDILDVKLINFAIDYEVIGDLERDKFDILSECTAALQKEFTRVRDVGEAFFFSDVHASLREVNGVVDVTRVSVKIKNGGLYSNIRFNIEENTSPDGRYIEMPINAVFEIKYPDNDIKGSVK